MPPKYSKRVRVKSPYYLADGTAVPGVTTILRVLNKPFLVPWANKLGLAGVDSTRYTDEKAAVGTLAHSMCLKDMCQEAEELDLADYSPNEISQAENAFLKFCEWKKAHVLEPILVEKPLVSEAFRFGGTPDFYGKVDGILTLLDLKTGGIWPEHFWQIAAYGMLLAEAGHHVDQRILLNIGRDETENFVEAKRQGPSLEDEVLIFRSCLDIYNAKKRLKVD